MKHPSRSERIYQAVAEGTSRFDPRNPASAIETLQINALAQKTGILPNNISMELNRLFSDGLVMRVRGRPVTYFSISILEEILEKQLPTYEFISMDAFLDFLAPPALTAESSYFAKHLEASAQSAFDSLIGSKKSLHHSVVVGSAITRPHLITKRFTDLLTGYQNNWREAERSKH